MPKVLKRECIAQPPEARNLCGYWLGRAQECELPMEMKCRCARSWVEDVEAVEDGE